MFNKEFLINLIESNGVSLTTLEKNIGITHSALSLLVRGISRKPQPETIIALSKYFKVNPNDFFEKSNKILKNIHSHSISTTLKKLMQCSGIVNSSQLHRHTGIAIPTIDRIINGETKSPNENTLQQLAKFFNISIAQLKGIDYIPENKIINTIKSNTSIPIIQINNVIKWGSFLIL